MAARTLIAENAKVGSQDPNHKVITWTAADMTDNNYAVYRQGMIILVRNDDVGAQTCTLVQTADPQGRASNQTISLGLAGSATDTAVIGPLTSSAGLYSNETKSGDGDFGIHLDPNNANIKFAVLI